MTAKTESSSSNSSSSRSKKPRRKPKALALDQDITQYVSFGAQSTACLICFVLFYVLVLVCIFPMLRFEPVDETHHSPMEGMRGSRKLEEVSKKMRSELRKLRGDNGIADVQLMKEAIQEFELLRHKKEEKLQHEEEQYERHLEDVETPGVVVLGMHRSGTSMLAGLLVQGVGFNVGEPLIRPAFDNAKGFFERIDAVLQNDEFMKAQKIYWDMGPKDYDWEKGIQDKKSGKIKFREGDRALGFLNNLANAPWLQKDPRMCITLKTWLPLLHKKPAAVFTYRHPLEVAMSLNKRERNFDLLRGLRLWVVYNMRGIQNSQSLCRVYSSNDDLLMDARREVQRVADELVSKCGMPLPPKKTITQAVVEEFIEPNMQHNKKKLKEEQEAKMDVLEEYRGCFIKDYASQHQKGTNAHDMELDMYKRAMRIYCDLQSGEAYKASYEWPDLP